MGSNSQDQEINLGQVFNKLKESLKSVSNRLFDLLLFIKRNIILLLVLTVVGVSLGFYLDSTNKSYKHTLIVKPNFGSNEYMYAKIELLNAKRKEQDTAFLKAIGIKDVINFSNIEIEPIIDVYKFIEYKPENFDLIKLMAEDGSIQDVIKDDITSKNYQFHLITFNTKGTTSKEKTVTSILKFLNDSKYYDNMKAQHVENIKREIASVETTIAQINDLLNAFSETTSKNQKSDNLVYYNENSQLNDIIENKEKLTYQLGEKKIKLINSDVTIKEISTIINIPSTKGINGKTKLILPALLLALFFFFTSFRSFYKKQLAKRNTA